MNTTTCLCGASLYFENVSCSACQRTVGWCDACNALHAVEGEGSPYQCGGCGAELMACPNREAFGICNGLVLSGGEGPSLCRRCVVTTVTPDTSDATTVGQWRVLEEGKRLLLNGLDNLGLVDEWREGPPPLRFHFAASEPDNPVLTGHAEGVITINLQEADPVHRERARQDFGEPQRTVIGHLRHEFGHYLQLRLFGDEPDEHVTKLFGDPTQVAYPDALEAYYANGPARDWRQRHISAYASAHPWEDFAETASFYLDMMAVLDTLFSHGVMVKSRPREFRAALDAYLSAALVLNEVNRTMGLLDLVPYVVPPTVVEKLELIDQGVRSVSAS